MSRRIQTGIPAGVGAAGAIAGGGPHEDFIGRLVKYVPTEIVGLYLAASGVVPKDQTTWAWIVFGLCFVITPFYLWFATRDPVKGPLLLQIALATVAFPVWVFAIGGPFADLPWYKGFIASIVLIFVTFVFGWIKPKPGS
jgi:hypothetical protein